HFDYLCQCSPQVQGHHNCIFVGINRAGILGMLAKFVNKIESFLQGNMHEITAAEGCESVRFHANVDDPDAAWMKRHVKVIYGRRMFVCADGTRASSRLCRLGRTTESSVKCCDVADDFLKICSRPADKKMTRRF